MATFSGYPGLGDGPESVAGAQVFGVLHAPGYIIYSGLGWLFIRALPFVSAAMAVSLLSLVASLGAVALVYLSARRTGAAPAGAGVGAVLFGLTTSVWFYASYAKHTALTTLAAAALVYLTVRLYEKATTRRLAAFGGLLGLSLGLGWPVVATVAPATFWVLWRRVSWRRFGLVAGTGLAAGLAVGGLILWRASVSPTVNWGGASTASRLVDLLLMSDFGLLSSPESSSVVEEVSSAGSAGLHTTLWTFLKILTRNVGLLTVLLATFAFASRLRRRWLLVAIATVNLVTVSIVLGVVDRGLDSVLIMGGFLAPSVIAVAVLAGVSSDWLIQHPRDWIRFSGLALVAITVAMSVVGHRSGAAHPDDDLALAYAEDVLEEVPPDGVIVAWLAERSFPLVYAQVVHGLRTDVTVVAADGLGADWYREQVADAGLAVVPKPSLDETVAASIPSWTGQGAPVHVDMGAWLRFHDLIATRVVGVTAEVTTEPDAAAPEATERILTLADRPFVQNEDSRRWPNETVMSSYPRAAVILADQALRSGDTETARLLLEVAARLDPDNDTVRRVLEGLP